MEYVQIIIVALLIEAIWENLKMVWKDKKPNANMIGTLIIAIAMCLLTQIDIFPMINITIVVPYVGCVLTGIIVARGSNFVNDLFTKLKDTRKVR